MREMTEQQYNALRERRRRAPAVSLSELSRRALLRQQHTGRCFQTPVARIVAEAAELLRRRELATAAWERVVPQAWAGDTAVTGLQHRDTAVVSVTSSPLLCELRRRQTALEQAVVRLAPGIRHLRFVVGGRV
jgi:hypothetical protein